MTAKMGARPHYVVRAEKCNGGEMPTFTVQ